MNVNNAYIDKIMSNHVFNSASSEDLQYLFSDDEYNNYNNEHYFEQDGGTEKYDSSSSHVSSTYVSSAGAENINNNTDEDKPNGGFPPIVIYSAKDKDLEQTKDRQLTGKKIGVSIKDILRSKK
jgi:hypothetical protein